SRSPESYTSLSVPVFAALDFEIEGNTKPSGRLPLGKPRPHDWPCLTWARISKDPMTQRRVASSRTYRACGAERHAIGTYPRRQPPRGTYGHQSDQHARCLASPTPEPSTANTKL